MKRLFSRLNARYIRLFSLLSFLLSGCLRDKRVTPTSTNLDAFRFDYAKKDFVSAGELIFYVVCMMAIAGLLIWLHFYVKRRNLEQMYTIRAEKDQKHTLTLLASLQITEQEEALLRHIAEAEESSTLADLLESIEGFQKAVKAYKHQNPVKAWVPIYHLRQKLGFDFQSRRTAFVCTQMLDASQSLECRIELPKKVISFMAPVMGVTERYLFIKPPRLKGKIVNLSKFNSITAKASRDDVEFLFTLSIVKQLTGRVKSVILEHTESIKTMFIREYERISVNIPVDCSHLSVDHSGEQANTKQSELPHFSGNILDISSGGVNIVTLAEDIELQVGDLLMFHIENVHIKDGITGRIVGVVKEEIGYDIHVQFFKLFDRDQWKIDKYIKILRRDLNLEIEVPSSSEKPDDDPGEKWV